MAGVVKIEVDLEGNEEAARGVRGLNNEIRNLPSSSGQASAAMVRTSQDIQRASDASDILAQRVGIVLPEAVRRFIAESNGMGRVLSSAFNFSIYLGAGYALFQMIQKVGEGLGWWGDKADELKRKNDELNKSIQTQIEKLETFYERLRSLQNQRSLIGLSGEALWSQELQNARNELESTQAEFETLTAQLNKLMLEASREKGNYRIVGGKRQESDRYIELQEEMGRVAEQLRDIEEKLLLAQEEYANKEKAIEVRRTEALKQENEKRLAIRKKAIDDYLALPTPYKDTFIPIEDIPFSGDDGDSFHQQWLNQRKADTESLQAVNEALTMQTMRSKRDYLGVLDVELAKIDELKAKYEGNADAIAALEERKRLITMQTNAEIARDAEDNFSRAATTIEGFFNRVFLTARSFSDVWKQLWSQLVGYAVSQVGKLVAAWWTGNQSMTQASITGGGNSSLMTQGIQAVLKYGGGGVAAAATSGAAMAMNVPRASNIPVGGGTDLSSIGSTGTGAISAGASLSGQGFNLGSFLTSPQGMMLGATAGLGLMQYGIQSESPLLAGIGGFVGGGFAGWGIGSLLGVGGTLGPWGALAGLGIGLLGSFMTSGKNDDAATSIAEQARDQMREIYESYSLHQVGYSSAISGLAQVFRNAKSSLMQVGRLKWMDRVVAAHEEYKGKIDNIELAREGRLDVMGTLPVPEFASGSNGIIRTSGTSQKGGFLAVLHPNEAVLNERAAAKLGDDKIKNLNSGASMGAGMTININAVDAKSFVAMVENNRGYFVNMIRQAALDAGLPVPV